VVVILATTTRERAVRFRQARSSWQLHKHANLTARILARIQTRQLDGLHPCQDGRCSRWAAMPLLARLRWSRSSC